MKLFLEFINKPWRIKKLLIEAMWLSVYYKIQINHGSFETLASKMGEFKYETPEETIDSDYIKDIKWVTYAIKRWTPWKTKCFDRALMAKKLLNKFSLPCTIYMGVRPDSDGKMIAHAWLRCGDVFVSGGNGSGYAVTGIYGDRIPK